MKAGDVMTRDVVTSAVSRFTYSAEYTAIGRPKNPLRRRSDGRLRK